MTPQPKIRQLRKAAAEHPALRRRPGPTRPGIPYRTARATTPGDAQRYKVNEQLHVHRQSKTL
jgi:hypothetical protein